MAADAAAERLRTIEHDLAGTLRLSLPHGHWDHTAYRFVDWVDRSGEVHDHTHLLAMPGCERRVPAPDRRAPGREQSDCCFLNVPT